MRLVRIERSSETTIRCSVRTVRLVKFSPRLTNLISANYLCLSYEWGAADAVTPTIMLNGAPFHVCRNLYNFLATAQTKPDYTNIDLWIDAICINQKDLIERNEQVAIMGDVFRGRRVVAWLGEDTGCTYEHRSLLAQIQTMLDICRAEESDSLIGDLSCLFEVGNQFLLATGLGCTGAASIGRGHASLWS